MNAVLVLVYFKKYMLKASPIIRVKKIKNFNLEASYGPFGNPNYISPNEKRKSDERGSFVFFYLLFTTPIRASLIKGEIKASDPIKMRVLSIIALRVSCVKLIGLPPIITS